MMESVACFAPTSPPDTGASRYAQPKASMRLAKSFVATGEIELMSMTILPGSEALRNSVLGEQNGLDVRRVRHHE